MPNAPLSQWATRGITYLVTPPLSHGGIALRWICIGRCRSFESAAGESLALSPAGLFDRTVPSGEGFRP